MERKAVLKALAHSGLTFAAMAAATEEGSAARHGSLPAAHRDPGTGSSSTTQGSPTSKVLPLPRPAPRPALVTLKKRTTHASGPVHNLGKSRARGRSRPSICQPERHSTSAMGCATSKAHPAHEPAARHKAGAPRSPVAVPSAWAPVAHQAAHAPAPAPPALGAAEQPAAAVAGSKLPNTTPTPAASSGGARAPAAEEPPYGGLSTEEEAARLAALRALGVDYTAPDPRFDSVVKLVRAGPVGWLRRQYSMALQRPYSTCGTAGRTAPALCGRPWKC